jgi:hypothetical protein
MVSSATLVTITPAVFGEKMQVGDGILMKARVHDAHLHSPVLANVDIGTPEPLTVRFVQEHNWLI